MAGGCCSRPITRIIKVAEFDAGLIGLDKVLEDVCGRGLTEEAEIQRELLRCVREFGNYVSPSREADYGKALLREYGAYVLQQRRPDRLPHRGAPGSLEG